MKRLLIISSLTISLILSSLSPSWSKRIGFLDYSPMRKPAPEINLDKLEKITLEEGLDQYQTEAVVEALIEELIDIFKFHVTDSHFIWECRDESKDNCRHNLFFWTNFKAQTKDLNNDNYDDVIVEVIHPSSCGSGGCYQYILLNKNGKWKAIGQSRSTYYLSKKDSDGKSTFYYSDNCGEGWKSSSCEKYLLEFK